MDKHQTVKIKIGSHELEASGDPDIVREQFEAFMGKVAEALQKDPVPRRTEGDEERISLQEKEEHTDGVVGAEAEATPDQYLGKIMHVDDKVVSLTAPADDPEDASLLIIYGQKILRGHERVSGHEIMEGLKVSGLSVPRVDRILHKPAKDGDLLITGKHRAKRYRMTHRGMNRARALAKDLLDIVA